MLQANSLLLGLSWASRFGAFPRLFAGFAGSQVPVRVALRGRHFREMIAPNNSFNPNPLRYFVQTCHKLLHCKLTVVVAAGRVNSGVRRVKARATAGFSASDRSGGHSTPVVVVFGWRLRAVLRSRTQASSRRGPLSSVVVVGAWSRRQCRPRGGLRSVRQ